MDFLNVKSQLVEIPVLAGSTLGQFRFPTQDFLRNKYIVSIEAYNSGGIAFAPSGNAVITAANMSYSFLTLYEQNPESKDAQGLPSSGDGQWTELFPLVTLNRIFGGNNNVVHLSGFVPRTVIWEKSFVQLASSQTLGNVAAVSFLFNVGYIGNGGDAKG